MSKQNNNQKNNANKKAERSAVQKKAGYQKPERKKHYTKEDYRMKKRNYTVGAIFCLLAVVLAISAKVDGKISWDMLQIGVYTLLGISGIFLKSGAKYEENAARAKALDLIGLLFVALCLGMVITLATT